MLIIINETLVDIHAFWDSVIIYQNPRQNLDFLPDDVRPGIDHYDAKAMLAPVELEKAGRSILRSLPVIDNYTPQTFASYLSEITTYFHNTPFCLQVNTVNHELALVYNPETKKMVVVNSNDYYAMLNPGDDVAKIMFDTLGNPPAILLKLSVCVSSQYKAKLKKFCRQKKSNSIDKTIDTFTELREVIGFLRLHMPAGPMEAIKEIIAFAQTGYKKEQIEIFDIVTYIAIEQDDTEVLSLLLGLDVMKAHLVLQYMFNVALRKGATGTIALLLKQDPELIKNPDSLMCAALNLNSLRFILASYAQDKQTEIQALSYRNANRHDALFYSITHESTFALILEKYLKVPELYANLCDTEGPLLALLEKLLKHTASLEVLLQAANSNEPLRQALSDTMNRGIFKDGVYTGTLLHRALQYPKSWRVLLSFLPTPISLAEMQDSADYGRPYLAPPPFSALSTSASSLIELLLTNRSMITFVLSCYSLEDQLALLNLHMGNSDTPLFEADCFSEEFKRDVRAYLAEDEAILSTQPPLSLDKMFKADKIHVSPEFIFQFEAALNNPEKFEQLISSLSDQRLYDLVSFPINGLPSLLMRSILSPTCFNQLLCRLNNLPDEVNGELLGACLKFTPSLQVFLQHISREKIIQFIVEKFPLGRLFRQYRDAHNTILEKIRPPNAASVAEIGMFGSTAAQDEQAPPASDLAEPRIKSGKRN